MVHRMAAESGPTSSSTSAASKNPPVFTTVEQLRPDTRGHNLLVKVGRFVCCLDEEAYPCASSHVVQVVASKLVLNKQGGRGPNTRIAEVLLGDETGVIVFSAKNEQVDVLAPGNYAVLRNARVDMFKGSMRLVVDQWGKVDSPEKPQPAFAAKVRVSSGCAHTHQACLPPYTNNPGGQQPVIDRV